MFWAFQDRLQVLYLSATFTKWKYCRYWTKSETFLKSKPRQVSVHVSKCWIELAVLWGETEGGWRLGWFQSRAIEPVIFNRLFDDSKESRPLYKSVHVGRSCVGWLADGSVCVASTSPATDVTWAVVTKLPSTYPDRGKLSRSKGPGRRCLLLSNDVHLSYSVSWQGSRPNRVAVPSRLQTWPLTCPGRLWKVTPPPSCCRYNWHPWIGGWVTVIHTNIHPVCGCVWVGVWCLKMC